MQVCGVICEYNPFHRGHALHLERAKSLSGADYIVCVMSGSVTQRGVFAHLSKWTRAEMALMSGCDLVLELPARFSFAPAEEFARGGVSLLDRLGVVSHLSFGCEQEALSALDDAVQIFREESPTFKEALRAGLDQGLSYPRARALAARQVSGRDDLDALIALPNASLAIEYLRALPDGITPVPVVREGGGYHDEALGELASATAIRAALARGETELALSSVPRPDLLRAALDRGDMHEEEALTQALLYRLRTMSAADLSAIAGMEEGLEHRFLAAAKTARTRDELILAVKSKRYTYARLSRLCMNVLLGVTRDFVRGHAAPTYARVLGFRREAQPLLRAIKEHASIPLVTKAADYDRADPLFALDVLAQDLWSLGCASPDLRVCGRDFTTGPVIL
ncbi:MAG: nucleotidyltransferase family protein [Clostridiales bacterium]|nr:nucleotidyltransferase family protein [Clostridiales bacterium]